MAQTFYIEADEEIISVVGRLRHASETEIALVVPKRAILMQSIVSLKLLEREAKKIGKAILIVSQDDNGRALAEKAGLPTRSYQEEQLRQEEELSHQNNGIRPVITGPEPVVEFSEPKPSYAMKAENIGSESFFSLNQGAHSDIKRPMVESQISASAKAEAPVMRIAVRDKSPKYQTALNSKQSSEPKLSPPKPLAEALGSSSFGAPLPASASPLPEKKSFLGSQPQKPFPQVGITPRQVTPTAAPQIPVTVHSRIKFAIALAGIAVIALIGGVSFFLFTPRATITVLPIYSTEQSVRELSLIHSGSNSSQTEGETLEVPYRLEEMSLDVPVSITPTGVGTGGERKARGKVVIYNEFSTDPQPLVATTRLETKDGIIFRLTQGVTVPGMTDIAGKKEPGAIEAEVIADQAGESFNVTATTFKIPGFKGNAKYDKFSAKSLAPMSGGSKNGASGDLILTASDIEQAKKLGKEQALDMLRKKLGENLQEGEKIDENGIELTAKAEEPILHEGLSGAAITTVFHYEAKAYLVSGSVIERALLRILAEDKTLVTGAGLPLVPKTITIDSMEIIPDFKSGGGKLKVTASTLLSTDIKTEALKDELLGKKSDQLRAVLDKHPEIVKMSLDIQPNIFLKYIPKNKDRVTVVIADPARQ